MRSLLIKTYHFVEYFKIFNLYLLSITEKTPEVNHFEIKVHSRCHQRKLPSLLLILAYESLLNRSDNSKPQHHFHIHIHIKMYIPIQYFEQQLDPETDTLCIQCVSQWLRTRTKPPAAFKSLWKCSVVLKVCKSDKENIHIVLKKSNNILYDNNFIGKMFFYYFYLSWYTLPHFRNLTTALIVFITLFWEFSSFPLIQG